MRGRLPLSVPRHHLVGLTRGCNPTPLMQAAVANPAVSESAMSLANDVHSALVSMMVDEAFSAALETEASINADAKQRDMQGGFPVVTVRRVCSVSVFMVLGVSVVPATPRNGMLVYCHVFIVICLLSLSLPMLSRVDL